DDDLLEAIDKLSLGGALKLNGQLVAARLGESDAKAFNAEAAFDSVVEYTGSPVVLKYPEDIFRKNDTETRKDFALLTKGRASKVMSSTNTIIGEDFFAE